MTAILCLLTVSIGGLGHTLFARLQESEKAGAVEQLTSIGKLKAGQIQAFLAERRGDALILSDLLSAGLAHGWLDGKGTDLPEALRRPLESALAHNGYVGAVLLNAKGTIRFSRGPHVRLSDAGQSLAMRAMNGKSAIISDIYYGDPAAPEQPMLDIFAPVMSKTGHGRMGVLVLRRDLRVLFSLIQSWPVESKTAESLLVRQDGDHVLFLNELRHRKQTALKLRVPLKADINAPAWPAIRAAQRQYGSMESIDYRGHAVLAYTLPVPETSWSMVVKVDVEEVLVHLQHLQTVTIIVTVLLVALTFVLVSVWLKWRRQRIDLETGERQRTEHRIAAIVDSAIDAIISVNEDQRIVLFNPTAERVFGCAAHEALGQPLARFIPTRFRDAHREHIRAFGESGKTARKMDSQGTVIGIRADGQEFPIEASISKMQIDGHTLYTVILRDITERMKIAEREAGRARKLRQLSELGLMLSGAPEDIFRHVARMIGELFAVRVVCLSEIVGRELVFKAVYVNGEVILDAGGCPIDVTPCATVEISKDLRMYDRVAERFPQASFLRDHNAYAYCGFPSIDGAGRVVAVTCLLDDKPHEFPEEDQEILRIIGQRIATEVERAHHVAKREEAETRYRLLFEQSPDGIVIVDPATLKPVEFNTAAHHQLGYSRHEFAQLRIADIEAKELPEEIRSRAEMLLRTGAVEFETMHRTKGGRVRNIWIKAWITLFRGTPSFVSIWRDITERKRAEGALQAAQEQVRQMQKMEALSRLAGSIAHDFNNLLTVILSQSELLLMALTDREPALRHDVEEITRAVRRGTALTQQLLTLSRRQPLQTTVLDLARLMTHLAPMLHRLLDAQITLEVHTDSPGCSIMADPDQIEQVLLNLVINARDAMPEGGRLTLTVASVDLDESAAPNYSGLPPGHYARLTVSDTGSGMDEETQQHLFEPFFTTKEKGKGTGLGLATVFGIVTQSGGHIAHSSAPGQGTTFTLDFPCLGARAIAPSEPTPASAKPAPGTETILLVEDDDAVRHATLRILCQVGYTVLDTASPLEALRLLEHHPTISLLLTDVVMPQMAGDELARRVKALHPAIPVIHMSGYTATAQLHDGRLPSGDAFLAKPFTADALLRAIREVLDNPT